MDSSPKAPNVGIEDLEQIRSRARHALERGDFEWVERRLAQGEIDLAELTENLRVYQAELEIQNTELRANQAAAERMANRYNALFSAVPLGPVHAT